MQPVKVLRKSCKMYKGRVYNLRVAKSPTYFANGILVHNCYCYVMPVAVGEKGKWTEFRASDDWYGDEGAQPAQSVVPGFINLAKKQDEAVLDIGKYLGFPVRLVLFTQR